MAFYPSTRNLTGERWVRGENFFDAFHGKKIPVVSNK
jgi:hypothetical protein